MDGYLVINLKVEEKRFKLAVQDDNDTQPIDFHNNENLLHLIGNKTHTKKNVVHTNCVGTSKTVRIENESKSHQS